MSVPSHQITTCSVQTALPCLFMRGGTSRGPFFRASDLPSDAGLRDQVLLAVMGSPDARQIDGLGGAHPLTSKVGLVSPGATENVDLAFLFAQVGVEKDIVDTTPNCGNMLAAVLPFALETGMLAPRGEQTTARVLTLNTGMACDITVETPDGRVRYGGDARIDGVPGTAAPIRINFLDTAGSVCSGLLPTGSARDTIDGIPVTCIDNGMPMVLLAATEVGRTGYESAAALNADSVLKARLESLRLAAGERMGLGDVRRNTYPKMCLLAPPRSAGNVSASDNALANIQGSISTRTFIPHVCHDAIGVLQAVTVATACVLEGSVAKPLAVLPEGEVKPISVEHPSGEFSVELALDPNNPQRVARAALVRTARLLMRGEVMIPASIWNGHRA